MFWGRVFLIVGVLFLGSCKKKSELAESDPAFLVTAVKAIQKDAPLYLEAIGHVESIERIKVMSRVEGELTGVYFKEGDYVKKGDLLFTIDPRPYEAKLKFAEGTLAENLANLKLAQEKVLRYTTLVQEEYYSEIDYRQLQTTAETDDALVKKAEADVEDAKINLNYCWIYSPIEGKTGILQIDKGNLVRANDQNELITINQISPIYVTFALSEKFLPTVQKYQCKNPNLPVNVSYEDFKEDTFKGFLEVVDNQVDPETGMIKFRGKFDNEDKKLWPGLFVRTRLILDTIKDAILIPSEAVDYTQNGSIVYVVNKDKTVDKRNVKLGQRIDDQIIIISGVEKNEMVVTDGMLNLYSGAKVQLQKTEKENEPL
ncbi:MAG: efflux RND transporter periplasmic adaptor subunit [Chlamydiae bacterium CG10_big_fil_rev_8_21_14_0_10_35_9]|nr:MAG: efflux RND transporter periplasmic adaptor subunit [Chlamydiae bacterium CG10_big_fil_rev_8_21_14_0_10_35_9]